jgi:hypothetical protein
MLVLLSLHFLQQHRLNSELNKLNLDSLKDKAKDLGVSGISKIETSGDSEISIDSASSSDFSDVTATSMASSRDKVACALSSWGEFKLAKTAAWPSTF